MRGEPGMLAAMPHRTADELVAGLDEIRRSPADRGVLRLIVRRPAVDEREILAAGTLSPADGLVGDTWNVRPSRRTPDGSPHPDMQLNVMNARVAALLGEQWELAGDQLYVDIDLSHRNLPPGSCLQIGTAVIQVTEPPHRGCAKFAARFGQEALRFVNSPAGEELRLRGLNARVVVPGTVRTGDLVRKSAPGL